MSSFMVEHGTIERIVGWIKSDFYEGPGELSPWCDGEEGYRQHWQGLATRMWEMNRDAVVARYGQKALEGVGVEHPPMVGPKPEVWMLREGMAREDLWQVLKSLQCYLCQCSEGTMPARALYKQLRKAGEKLLGVIVEWDPRYDAATWG